MLKDNGCQWTRKKTGLNIKHYENKAIKRTENQHTIICVICCKTANDMKNVLTLDCLNSGGFQSVLYMKVFVFIALIG